MVESVNTFLVMVIDAKTNKELASYTVQRRWLSEQLASCAGEDLWKEKIRYQPNKRKLAYRIEAVQLN